MTFSWRKKSVFTGVICTALLGSTELFLRQIWGDPPMSDMISRTRQCQIVDAGDRVGMDCEPGLREDVWTTPTP